MIPSLLAAERKRRLVMSGVRGASSDTHSPHCKLCGGIRDYLAETAGPVMATCIQNRQACAASSCSGHGRCADYDPDKPLQACQGGQAATRSDGAETTCICDAGWSGERCGLRVGGGTQQQQHSVASRRVE